MPFTTEQFFAVFARYNQAVWPAQLALTLVALLAVLHPRIAGYVLALLWLWSGVFYHLAFFTAINGAAWAFGVAFVVSGALVLAHTLDGSLTFEHARTGVARVGYAAIAYALVGYPLIAYALGERYPAVPTFGLPCPITILTLGFLALAKRPAPKSVFVVPIAWSVIGTFAAVKFGVLQDYALIVTAVAVLVARRAAAPSHGVQGLASGRG